MSLNQRIFTILFIFFIFEINIILSYPIFPTILTVSIPISEKSEQSRVENSYLRWLQASGADLIAVHSWTPQEEIDFLLSKVNGVLFQGNPNKININSDYYKIIKYIYQKVIEINNSGVKMPIISIGDDASLLSSIIAGDDTTMITNLNYPILHPSNINLFSYIDKTIIFKEFEQEDMKALEEENILPNNLNRFITVTNFMKNFYLNQKFNIIATSKSDNGVEYVSVLEGKKYPIIMITFHPEYVVFEQNKNFIIPDTLKAIYTSRFIGNSFVFFGRNNVPNIFTIEEKEEHCYIDPYDKFPSDFEGRYNFIFNKN